MSIEASPALRRWCRFHHRVVCLACLWGASLAPAAAQCVDYADYLHPVARIATASPVRSIIVEGSTVFVAERFGGLRILQRTESGADTLASVAFDDLIEGMVYDAPYLYVAARSQGLVTLDVGNPGAPVVLDAVTPRVSANGIARHGPWIFLAESGYGVTVIDVSDPGDLQRVGDLAIEGGARAVAADYPYLYVAHPSGLLLLDIMDASRPTRLGEYAMAGGAHSLAYEGDRVYAGGRSVDVISVTLPHEPQRISSFPATSTITSLLPAGALLYATDYEAGLEILDVSVPGAPLRVSSLSTLFEALVLDADGSFLYVGDTSGLSVFDASNPRQVQSVGVWPTEGEPAEVLFAGNLAYLADRSQGLLILNAGPPAAPLDIGQWHVEGRLNVDGGLTALALHGNYLYATGTTVGLLILDVRRPASVEQLARLSLSWSGLDILLDGEYAHIAGYGGASGGGIETVDISNPQDPEVVGTLPFFMSHPTRLAAEGNWLFAAVREDGLILVDRSHPRQLFVRDTVAMTGKSRGLAYRDGLAYLVSGPTMQIVDLADPTDPVPLGAAILPALGTDISLRGYHAYVSTSGTGVQVLDIRDPEAPFLLGAAPAGPASAVIVREDHLWVGCEPASLCLYPAQCYEGDIPLPTSSDLRALLSPRPNPCRGEARLGFDLPVAADVQLTIFDVAGRRVIELLEGRQAAGPQQLSWNGRDQAGRPVGSGVYLVRLQWNATVETRRLIRLR